MKPFAMLSLAAEALALGVSFGAAGAIPISMLPRAYTAGPGSRL